MLLPTVLDELVPAAWHHVEQYANNPIEADHGQLKRRLRPMRGLQTDRTTQVIAAAAAICVGERHRATAELLLAGDVADFDALLAEQAACEQRLAEVLPQTPAQVLTSIPGVGVLTASYYGAALGDASRFTNADAACRHSGLAPTSYESVGRRSSTVRISKVVTFGDAGRPPSFTNRMPETPFALRTHQISGPKGGCPAVPRTAPLFVKASEAERGAVRVTDPEAPVG